MSADQTPTPVTIKCTGCGDLLPVPCHVVSEDVTRGVAHVDMDYTQARAHMRECRQRTPQTAVVAKPAPALSRTELAGRIANMLAMRAYIAPGHRYCLGCGTKVAECLAQLQRTQAGCCGMCTEGNSHPAPGESKACAEWAAERVGGGR